MLFDFNVVGEMATSSMETIQGVIEEYFGCDSDNIENICLLKKGMTNHNYSFEISGDRAGKYILRVPGEGTEKLINRRHEADVYRSIEGKGICDAPLMIDPDTGYKISGYIGNGRCCDPAKEDDVRRCIGFLKGFHALDLSVDHEFDLYGQLEYYELLRGQESIYDDYAETKKKIYDLKRYIDSFPKKHCLSHIDSVPDNFLLYKLPREEEERIQLTDWEYAGMQDPHIDIAMFCIYSLYDKEQCDHVVDLYFDGSCDKTTRAKIYCYISVCGLLWSNWCEYKKLLGVEFGEYGLRQYQYATEFYGYACELLK